MPNMNKIQGQTYYCKMCFDAGKTELVYSSHCIRDSKKNITCPLLLSIKCRNCSKMGHTSKYCKAKSRATFQVQKPSVVINQEPPKKKSQLRGFEMLTYDSSSDDDADHDALEPESDALVYDPDALGSESDALGSDALGSESDALGSDALGLEPVDNWSKYSGVDWNEMLSDDDEFV